MRFRIIKINIKRTACPMGTDGSFLGGNAAGAWNWSLIFI